MKKIQTTKNFRHLNEDRKNNIRGTVLEGGSRSAKTWSIIQFLIYYLMQNTGNVVTIGRDHLTTLKKTLYLDFQQILSMYGIHGFLQINKSEMYINFNGNHIRFIGLNDDIMLTHGLTQDIFWINESINISSNTFDQLEQRTSKFWILDYNPITTIHWIYDMELRGDVNFHKSTILDNPFAPKQTVKKIQSYEPTKKNKKLGTADEYKWKVYGLGIRSTSETTVFRNWDYFEKSPGEYDLKVYGLDFGYSNNPTAIVECIIHGNNLYLTEILYKNSLLNGEINNFLKTNIENVNDYYIVADSAEPKSINELRGLDLPVIAAKKGADSVRYGINKLLTYHLFINKKSINLQNEFINYKYQSTKDGEVLNDPVKENDHLIDAARYAVTKFS